MPHRPLKLGISLGDPAGIGPEIALKALQSELATDDTHYVLIGNPPGLRAWAGRLNVAFSLPEVSSLNSPDRVAVIHPDGSPSPPFSPGSCAGAEAALAWLKTGARLCLSGELDGLVTGPLSKEAVLRTGLPFTGQTEFLTELAGNPGTVMMLLGQDDRDRWLRVALVTTHLPMRDLASAITPERVERTVRLASQACRQLRLDTARIAVCGLNPHAGEGGLLGDEELKVIQPTLQRLQTEGFDVQGPISGDTVFHAAIRGHYDVVVAMYHDQGLAPLKLVAFETGVNWTVGLPFIRTSPDHGPAYDIADQGVANASSMRAAIRLARRLAYARSAARV